MNAVDGVGWLSNDGIEMALRNQFDAMFRCDVALVFSKCRVQRRHGEFEHQQLPVWFCQFLNQSFQTFSELCCCGGSQHIVSANFKDDKVRFDRVLAYSLQSRANGFANMGNVLYR